MGEEGHGLGACIAAGTFCKNGQVSSNKIDRLDAISEVSPILDCKIATMDNTQPLLLALLVKHLRQSLRNNIDYGPVLEAGNLQTPQRVWNARDRLRELCPSLSIRETTFLEVAATLLTGAIFVRSQLFVMHIYDHTSSNGAG